LLLSLDVQIGDSDFSWTFYLNVYAGKAQASLFDDIGLFPLPRDLRIDHHIGFFVEFGKAHPKGVTHLRCSYAESAIIPQGIFHIFEDLEDVLGHFLNEFRFLSKNRIIGAGLNGEDCQLVSEKLIVNSE